MQKIYCRSILPDGYGEGVVPERDMINIPVVRGYDEKGKIHNDWQKWLDQKEYLASLPVLYLIHPDLAKVGWVGEFREQWQYRRDGLSTWYNCSKNQAMTSFETDRRIILVPVEGKEQIQYTNGEWSRDEYPADKAEEKEVGLMTLEELLDYMPPCVDFEDKTYCLHFFKGTSGFIVEYSNVEENIHVDLDGIKFTRKTTLFDTFRMDKSLHKAITSFLSLLIDNKDKLRFIPRIHPLNDNK